MPSPYNYNVQPVNALASYRAGVEQRQADDQQSALKQYLPQAVQGDTDAISNLASTGGQNLNLLQPLLAHAQSLGERQRQLAEQDATVISTAFRDWDPSKSTPQETQQRMQAAASALSPQGRQAFSNLTPDQIPGAVQRANYMPAAIQAAQAAQEFVDKHVASQSETAKNQAQTQVAQAQSKLMNTPLDPATRDRLAAVVANGGTLNPMDLGGYRNPALPGYAAQVQSAVNQQMGVTGDPATAGGVQQEYTPGGPPVGTRITPQQAGQSLLAARQNQASQKQALQRFTSGPQGNVVRSLNVSVAHLETLRDLGAALQNGNMQTVNAISQQFAQEFGVPAPTNFDTAKSIVADEVAKGVIGGQTAQADREQLAASIRRASSPQQIAGSIDTFQRLLAGQLGGLREQYKTATGREDFDSLLNPITRQVLGRFQEAAGSAPAQVTTKAQYDALKPGTAYIAPDGSHRVKQ